MTMTERHLLGGWEAKKKKRVIHSWCISPASHQATAVSPSSSFLSVLSACSLLSAAKRYLFSPFAEWKGANAWLQDMSEHTALTSVWRCSQPDHGEKKWVKSDFPKTRGEVVKGRSFSLTEHCDVWEGTFLSFKLSLSPFFSPCTTYLMSLAILNILRKYILQVVLVYIPAIWLGKYTS